MDKAEQFSGLHFQITYMDSLSSGAGVSFATDIRTAAMLIIICHRKIISSKLSWLV
jgi:hypothetical protein